MKWMTAAALGLVALAVDRAAAASETYPTAMKGDLGLDYTPGCDLCHAHAETPVGDANRPFAVSLVKRGLQGNGDVASLQAALTKDKGVDSDGDGAEDLDEIFYGGDPNVADDPIGKPPPAASYGCSLGEADPGAPLAAAIALGLLLVKRRRLPARAKKTSGAPK